MDHEEWLMGHPDDRRTQERHMRGRMGQRWGRGPKRRATEKGGGGRGVPEREK